MGLEEGKEKAGGQLLKLSNAGVKTCPKKAPGLERGEDTGDGLQHVGESLIMYKSLREKEKRAVNKNAAQTPLKDSKSQRGVRMPQGASDEKGLHRGVKKKMEARV